MMCGKPIIVNDHTSMSDIVREEKCGLIVSYGDVNSIKDAIVKLRNDLALREELGNNGRLAYEQKYSWKIMEKRLLAVYKNILN
jgi:glycosyltransferase involved in cell wall biosynthesis